MPHEPSTDWGADKSAGFKSKLGLILFACYAVFYGIFIALSAINPAIMGMESLGGLNLAIVYGFTLILSAFLMGLLYHFICYLKEKSFEKKPGEKE
jgi:uncharacterized membrane protein (DUF485 family)